MIIRNASLASPELADPHGTNWPPKFLGLTACHAAVQPQTPPTAVEIMSQRESALTMRLSSPAPISIFPFSNRSRIRNPSSYQTRRMFDAERSYRSFGLCTAKGNQYRPASKATGMRMYGGRMQRDGFLVSFASPPYTFFLGPSTVSCDYCWRRRICHLSNLQHPRSRS